MGICMSYASSGNGDEIVIRDTYENAVIIDSRSDKTPTLIGSVYSQQGQKGLNQDSAILQQGFGTDDGALCGVFDGHGMNGQVVSKLVRECLPSLLLDTRKSISSSTNGNDYVEEWSKACIGAYQMMDDGLKSRRENLDCSCSGTTSVTIIKQVCLRIIIHRKYVCFWTNFEFMKQGQDLVTANLGDSRAVLGTSSDNGELMAVQLTVDLKPGLPEEAERITKSKGRIFALVNEAHIERVWLPNQYYPGLAMARAFGNFDLKEYGVIAVPQISLHRLNSNDKFVVLASDGVWDVLRNDQVVSIMSSATPETAAKAVVDAAVVGWKRFPHVKMDDISVSCMFFHERSQNLSMGICMSCASSSNRDKSIIQDTHENAVFIDSRSDNTPSLVGSVYSQQGSKEINQDSAVLVQGFGTDDGAVCGVFDGHGMNGHTVSKVVRESLPSLLLDQKKSISSSTNGDDYVEEWSKACIGAYQMMDDELKSRENLECSCSGTTSVSVIKQGEDLIIANLGDSRAVLGTSSDNGVMMALQLTTDLKPSVPEEVERIRTSNGRVFALEKEAHIPRVWLPDEDYPGLAMTRAFGDFDLKDYGIIAIPQISHHHLNINDKFVVLASDGVWDVLSNDQVVSIMSSARPETAAKAVVDAAVVGWRRFPHFKMDDVSVSCMFFHERSQSVKLSQLIS
ncbi:hypothetical protein MKX01_001002 [Papaver californicum]|nr:hypothetical protein MKX01_001002 [Papaver californicum]